ncbi:MAG TPA: patatin-like phospholipase family protein [Edaphobacter sp.]
MRIARLAHVLSLVLATACTAAQTSAPTPTPASHPRRPSIALVLEGGGALGIAHVGVLQWLEDNHIPIDGIAGTSMGALVGGLYASGKSPKQISNIAGSDLFSEIFSVLTPYEQIGYRRREDRRDLPQAITFGLKHGVSLRNAVLSDTELNSLLLTQFAVDNRSEENFDNLPIPFRCVATDLNDFEPVIFRNGSLPKAIRASISIPGVFPPVPYNGHYLVDGAMMNNLPTDVARTEFKSDVVIAVHLKLAKLEEQEIDSILGVVSRALSAGVSKTEKAGMAHADLVLTTDTTSFTTSDYLKSTELLRKGYEAAESQRATLLRYQLTESEWGVYLTQRNARRSRPAGRLVAVQVDGGTPGEVAVVRSALASAQGKPIDASTITRSLRNVESGGTHRATFETFTPRGGNGSESGLIVHLRESHNGPPFLLLGAEITATTSNITRGTIDMRYIHQDLGGYGSELRVDGKLGFLTHGSVEYYRPLTASGFFVQPHLSILREPVYLWSKQQRISERFQQNAGGGLDLGRTFSRRAQLAAEWRAYVTRWRLVSGADTSHDLSGTSQTAVLRFSYDSALTAAVSPRGWRIDASAGGRFSSVASVSAPLVQVSISRTDLLGRKNVIGFRTETETYLRRNVADPFRFTLGGPLRLSASSIDEYRGTDDYLVRTGYLRRIASLPSGLGQGVYLTVAYEAGEIWSPERPAILRQNVLGGIVGSTPLGVITLGASVGDAGRRKVFLLLADSFRSEDQ